mmetsp:Transcript_57084/g.150218  ORF Transcript_57084/g.150218 Transcript_57084/m.150218 type:complete len:259 (+) Transcript_57084:924-1700(+)
MCRLDGEPRASVALGFLVLVERDVRLCEEVQRSCLVVGRAVGLDQPCEVVLTLRVPMLPVEDVAQVVQGTLSRGLHLEALLVELGGLVQVVGLAVAVGSALQGLGVHRAELQHVLEAAPRLVEVPLPAGVLPPTGRKLQAGRHVVGLDLEGQLELLPRLPELAVREQELTVGDPAGRRHAVELRQSAVALLLPGLVLQLLVDLQQFVPELGVVRNLAHRAFQCLLSILPEADTLLDRGHLHIDLPGLLRTGSALQGAS